MFEVCKDRFDRGDQGLTIQQQLEFALKAAGSTATTGSSIAWKANRWSTSHRVVGSAIGYLDLVQLGHYVEPSPLCTGFANGTESVIAGSPSIMIFGQELRERGRNLKADPQAWLAPRAAANRHQASHPCGRSAADGHNADASAALRRGVDPGGPVEQAAGEVRQAG